MDCKSAALEYARQGWQVIPLWWAENGICACGLNCSSAAKHPQGGLVPRGLLDATSDPEVIGRWWKHRPKSQLGILTGTPSGLVVLDIDGDLGRHSLEDLVREHGPLPDTPQVETGRGAHYYFRGASRTWKPAAGIDLKGEGGYVVAPPSVHATGRVYTWECSADPLEEPVRFAELPQWLSAVAAPKRVASSPDGPIASGNRNMALASLAGSMRRAGFDAAAIEAALQTTNTTRCDPPLAVEEVRRVAASVGRYEPEYSASSMLDMGSLDGFQFAAPAARQPVHDPGQLDLGALDAEIGAALASAPPVPVAGNGHASWAPPARFVPPPPRLVAAEPAPKLVLWPADLLYAQPRKKREWIVGDGLVGAGLLTLIVAAAKVGKSLSAIGLAAAVAVGFEGYEWLGSPINIPDNEDGKRTVLYLTAEGGMELVQERLELIVQHGPPRLVVQCDGPWPMLDRPDGRDIGVLRDAIVACNAELVIIDPLTEFRDLENEIDAKATRFLCGQLLDLAEETQCAIVIVHHPTKSSVTEGEGSYGGGRGSGILQQKVSTSISMRLDAASGEIHATFEVRHGRPVTSRRLRIDEDTGWLVCLGELGAPSGGRKKARKARDVAGEDPKGGNTGIALTQAVRELLASMGRVRVEDIPGKLIVSKSWWARRCDEVFAELSAEGVERTWDDLTEVWSVPPREA